MSIWVGPMEWHYIGPQEEDILLIGPVDLIHWFCSLFPIQLSLNHLKPNTRLLLGKCQEALSPNLGSPSPKSSILI